MEEEKEFLKEQKEKYGLQYDFEKYEDTAERFNDPAVWIAENLAQFINLMLMQVPPQLLFEAREKEQIVKKVLENIFDASELMLKKEMVHEKKEFVTNFSEWIWQGIMEFLYGDGGLTIKGSGVAVKWTEEEIEAAKPRAIKFLLQDLEVKP